jgi:ATP-dependent DNA helicase RecG
MTSPPPVSGAAHSRLGEPLAAVLGERAARPLSALGLRTVGDLLRHYPRRYGTPGEFTDIGALRVGEHVTVMAEIVQATVRPMRARGGAMLEAIVTDGKGTLALTFFAKRAGVLRMHEDKLRPGRTGLFTGTVGEYRGRRQLTHPDYLIVGLDTGSEEEAIVEAARPIPLYPATASVPTWKISRAVRTVLDPLTDADVPDPIPATMLAAREHRGLLASLRDVHVPEDDDAWARGQARLRYEEALILQAALAQRRAEVASLRSVARRGAKGGIADALDARLPFSLTAGQREVGERIASDLMRDVPMQRLLQGDVGSGKTVVALRAMLRVVDSGGQAALLAPTEVLAAQHLRTLRELMGTLAEGAMLTAATDATRITLVTGSQGSLERRQALAEAASGAAGIVVGTHALLGETVQFADLGLVVVDEQHRFGVEQRDSLRARGERPPHLLVMTATPIPRTVAMTVFGDLETSVLRDKPAGRADVVTHVVPADNAAWIERAWARVREEVARGRRAYVVCARIDGDTVEEGDVEEGDVEEGDEDEALDVAPFGGGEVTGDEAAGDDEALPDNGVLALDGALALKFASASPRPPLHAVVEVAQLLRERPDFAGVEVAVMHGRLRPEEKDAAMAAFASGAAPVMVCTTVIEVGVDVPQASVMLILDADHFGISTLHQLRGRIGRSDIPGICLLVSHADEASLAGERLAALAGTTDGFVLAEKDLELRREGDVLGAAQSGRRNSLRLLRVVRDRDIIEQARKDAQALVEADPSLTGHPALADAIAEWVDPERAEFLERS